MAFNALDYITYKDVTSKSHKDRAVEVIANRKGTGDNQLNMEISSKSEINEMVEQFIIEFKKLNINGEGDSGFDLIVELEFDDEKKKILQFSKIIVKKISKKHKDFFANRTPNDEELVEVVHTLPKY